MTFGKKTLFSLLLGIDILANISAITPINFLYISSVISFCTCILLPGFLISLILHIRKISFWENLLFIVGLSIAFLEFGGLLLNILLPLIGVNNPLAFQNLVIGFDVYILLLFIFAWIRTKQLIVQIQLPRRSNMEKALYALPLFFPILAALGAIVLNNGGSNILTLILLGTIALYSLLLVLFHAKIAVDLYPYAIFFIGIAVLFTTSLRSWYISGHDIEREYYVFLLTNTHHIWKMAFYQDAYNACLSITILPTVLSNLLSLQDMYIYKVIFQILFATSPVLVFFLIKKYTIPVFAFLSAFFFMSFPTFFNDMPMLNRQEIGFIFFGLVLYMMLLSEISLSIRKILFIIFAISVIVSHYSTNFVLLSLVIFVYTLTSVISLSFIKKMCIILLAKIAKTHITIKNTFNTNAFLSLPLLLILFLITYFWNAIYTNTSNHAGSVLTEVISSIFVRSSADASSSNLSYSIFSSTKLDPNQQLQEYIQSTIKSANSENINISQLYSKAISSKYNTYSIPQEQLTPTPLGNLLTTLHISVFNIQAELRSLSASFMQIFVFIGWLAFFFFKGLEETIDKVIPPRLSLKMRRMLTQRSLLHKVRLMPLNEDSYYSANSNISNYNLNFGNHIILTKYKKLFDLELLLLCLGAIFLLALITVLPVLSVEYGILRMFQQLLFVLSLSIVLGIYSILFFIKERERIIITGTVAIIFFLNLTGFISHLTGDYYPQMPLDNAGFYYRAYYVHGSDVAAILWLSENNVNNDPVAADTKDIDNIKLLTYGDINALNENFPAVLPKNAYVYLQLSNITVISLNDEFIYYNSDKPFLDKYKNLIYNNGNNGIYR